MSKQMLIAMHEADYADDEAAIEAAHRLNRLPYMSKEGGLGYLP